MSNKELFPLNSEQPASKDLRRLLMNYTRYWYLFLLCAIISLTTAFLYLRYYAVPQYMVSSTMLIKDDKSGQSLSSADALSDLSTFKTTRNIDNEIEVLKSVGIMERVVKDLSLYTSYYTKGRFIDREIYGQSVPIKILRNEQDSTLAGHSFIVYLSSNNSFSLEDGSGVVTSHKFGQQIIKPYGSFTIVSNPAIYKPGEKINVNFLNIHQVANRYNSGILVQPVGKTSNVLRLSLIDPIPERARNIINKLMEVYNLEAIEDKNIIAVSTIKFLDDRLKFITSELSGVEKGVERFKSTNSLTDIGTQASSYAEQATSYSKQLSEAAIQIDILETLENYLKTSGGEYSIVPSSLGISDETLLALIGKFNEVQLERERMLRTIQPTSLLIQNTNDQLANLRINILENLQNIKKRLQITSNSIKASTRQFQSKIQRVPTMERELGEINREQSIKQNIYVYLLQKREETALALAATASAARVLDFARGGDMPISPNRQTIYLVALLLGLGIPFAGIYLVDLFNNKVQTQQDVTGSIPVPIIGEIAHNSSKQTLVVTKGNRSAIAEMFQLIRTNLHFASINNENNVILVTSSMSGEGKTFFSINIGASIAATGKRVVLLDLDMRVPKVARELNLADGIGISNYLVSDDHSISDILRVSDAAPNLFVASAGSVPPNPAELLMSVKFAQLITELKKSFDYIILDTPPIGMVADAFVLSPFVSLTVYIVRYNYTNKAQLDIINNIYKNKTLNQPMIVLNDAKEQNGGNYGYGYGYGYGDARKSKAKSKSTI